MIILQRGAVIDLSEQKVVVLLKQEHLGWTCLCVSAHPSSTYYRQDIFVFAEDLKNGKIIPQIETKL